MKFVVASIMDQAQSLVDVPVILEGQKRPEDTYIELRITPGTFDIQPGHTMTEYTIDAAILYRLGPDNIYGFDDLLEDAKDLFPTCYTISDSTETEPEILGYLYLSSKIKTIPFGKLSKQSTYMSANMSAMYKVKEEK